VIVPEDQPYGAVFGPRCPSDSKGILTLVELLPATFRPMMRGVSGTRDIIRAALAQKLVDDNGKAVTVRLLPGLPAAEIDALADSLPVPPPDDVRDLLAFCSGIDGALEQIDFTGRSLAGGFGLDFLLPHGHPIAHDGCGNFWAIDLQPGASNWGPGYYCCHDAPVMLVQAATLAQFVGELFRKYLPPHRSLIDEVHEDRLFHVWKENPAVVPYADATRSANPELRKFAAEVGPGFELIDLRCAPIGMGFSWGRYGPRTDVRRFGSLPVFAYRKPEKTGLFARLFGR
jgi:SMI1 / KNR4 family (SUKH-1)